MRRLLTALFLFFAQVTMLWAGEEAGVNVSPEPFSVGVKLVSVLAILVAALLFSFYGVRRFLLQERPRGGREGLITVLATRYLGPKTGIVVARIGKEAFVLGVSATNVSLIGRLSEGSLDGLGDEEGRDLSFFHQIRSISERYGRKWAHPSGRRPRVKVEGEAQCGDL